MVELLIAPPPGGGGERKPPDSASIFLNLKATNFNMAPFYTFKWAFIRCGCLSCRVIYVRGGEKKRLGFQSQSVFLSGTYNYARLNVNVMSAGMYMLN